MIFLDACIFIYLLESAAGFSKTITDAIQASSNQVFCASELIRFECLVGPLKAQDDALCAAYERYFETVRMLEMSREVFTRAALIRARFGLKTPDSLHLATAIQHGCDEFWTGDGRLALLAESVRVRVFADTRSTQG